jgi:uncharacterized membrane protein YeaQ/YmgE (transglycosylase-associated protein family)
MENELTSAARNGLIRRQEEVQREDEAATHLPEARRFLEKAMNDEIKELSQPTGRSGLCGKEGKV